MYDWLIPSVGYVTIANELGNTTPSSITNQSYFVHVLWMPLRVKLIKLQRSNHRFVSCLLWLSFTDGLEHVGVLIRQSNMVMENPSRMLFPAINLHGQFRMPCLTPEGNQPSFRTISSSGSSHPPRCTPRAVRRADAWCASAAHLPRGRWASQQLRKGKGWALNLHPIITIWGVPPDCLPLLRIIIYLTFLDLSVYLTLLHLTCGTLLM